MQHFIFMHEKEPLFFVLELSTPLDEEPKAESGMIEAFHKDIYYIDGLSYVQAVAIMLRVGSLLFNDGISSFGYGCYENDDEYGDEIMFHKYNVLTIYSQYHIGEYRAFFLEHGIEEVDSLFTAWDMLTEDHPGESNRYEENGKTVYDIPKLLKKWGIYLAERRELRPGMYGS